MENGFFINELDLDHAVSVADTNLETTDYQSGVLKLAENFGIDKVYFCADFPAVFIKNVPDFGLTSLKTLAEIHHDVWNYKKVLQLYAISDVEIRIYNCSEKPVYPSQNTDYEKETRILELYRCQKNDKEKLVLLNKIFSRIAIDTGIIWTLEEASEIRKKINLQRRVDKYLVSSLISIASKLKNDEFLDIDLIHKLIMRSLFLLFLEDRGATDENFYKAIDANASNYFDILGSVESTYKLFDELETHFKGNLFTVNAEELNIVKPNHLNFIKRCFITGVDNPDQALLFEDWRVFDFKIIEIELLSEIYENFLTAIDAKKKDETGTFYTPPSLVELILNQKLPINNKETEYNVKILDPACGSGIFLVESFKRLIKRYENKNGEKLTDYTVLKKLLIDNIYGIELESKAIKVAAFSLYLALLENLNPKTLWQKKELPNLISDPLDLNLKEQGKNLFRRDTISENQDIDSIQFDLVVGNPPFGTKKLTDSIKKYCEKFGFAKEMVLPFLHKAVKFSPKGEIALIFNTKVLTNTGGTYQKFRDWLFNDCYVEKVFNFSILRKVPKNQGGQLFGSAVGPISIVFFKKEVPEQPNETIIYYAPKTYLKMDVLEGIVIDSSDVKYLPRNTSKISNSKIWKVAMWGGMGDINLISQLDKYAKLRVFLTSKKIKKGLGLQFLDESTKNPKTDNDIPVNYIPPKSIGRYFSSSFININKGLTNDSMLLYGKHYNVTPDKLPPINIFRRLGIKPAYKAPHILIKEGLKEWQICASFIDKDCSFNSKVLGFHHTDSKLLKGLTCFINSSLAYYYLFMVSASIGIEREEIKPNEIYDLPFILSNEQLYELSDLFDKEIKVDEFFKTDLTAFEKDVDNLIYRYFNITTKNQMIIENTVNNTFPLLFKGGKSLSLLPAKENHFKEYSLVMEKELSDFLTDSNLSVAITYYQLQKSNPLAMVKLLFGKNSAISESSDDINKELKDLDQKLYKKESTNIYFRKKLNYYDQDEILIIRPNQRRFWSNGAALEDATDLLNEILNMR
jgi:hypothetical protein